MRSMVKLIHADDFFPPQDLENLRAVAQGLNYVPMPYGLEVPNFNLIFPNIEQILYRVLGERVAVVPSVSGVFRKPTSNRIHFESFRSSEEWCFIVALEPTTVNLWHHIDPEEGMGDLSKANGRHAFDGIDYNYMNLFEWKIHTNILLEANQCLFLRPWVFHSMDDGLIQYYRLRADAGFRVLVMGHPGSKKDSVAEKLANKVAGSQVFDSMKIRHEKKDVDFSKAGHLRQTYRLLSMVRESTATLNVVNMACPLIEQRQILNCDVVVWVADQSSSQYPEFDSMFEPPVLYDAKVFNDDDDTIDNLYQRILSIRY